jgi:prepilin-type N-terminal cleavage/methylation domain-containing protein
MLRNKSGFTLIEVLVSILIIGVSIVGVYTGLVYAESSARIAYHNRSATLQASGWLDRMIYEKKYYSLEQLRSIYAFKTVDILIDEDISENDEHNVKLMGTITFDVNMYNDISTGYSIQLLETKVNVTWRDPASNKQMRITLMERIL